MGFIDPQSKRNVGEADVLLTKGNKESKIVGIILLFVLSWGRD